ncbi:hypothetical protein OAN96_01640, partial [Candidatus Gracilibacteria bacterium]|nr:hypothetical protein [Candidatus Gracilibacteria bacterium]
MSQINLINRLDVFVKILYIKAFLEGENYEYFKKLYIDHIRIYNGGKEEHKNNYKDFLDDFHTLIKSFTEKGFDHDFPIPLNSKGELLNGAHRLACCIYFGIKPVYKKSPSDISINWGLKWFQSNGFKQKDILN